MAALSQTFDPKAANLFNTGMPTLVLQNGTNIPESGYAFDAATAQQIFIVLGADFYLSGNLTVSLDWYSDAGNVVGDVLWGVQIAALSSGDAQSVLTDALATAQTNASTVNGTARGLRTGTVTVTNLDSLAVDDRIQMRIYRDAAAGGDTMAGNAILTKIKVSYASTAGAGAGNVSNAGGSTDNAIARFDLGTGQVIQDSPVTIADTTGHITQPAGGQLNGVDITNHDARHLPNSGTDTMFPGTYAAGDAPVWNGSAFVPKFEAVAELTTAQTPASTTLANITGLSVALPRAGTYWIEGLLNVGMATSAQLVAFAAGVSANFSRMSVGFFHTLTTATFIIGQQTANLAVGGAGVASGSHTIFTGLTTFSGSITVSGAATVQMLASRAANVLTIGANSSMTVREL